VAVYSKSQNFSFLCGAVFFVCREIFLCDRTKYALKISGYLWCNTRGEGILRAGEKNNYSLRYRILAIAISTVVADNRRKTDNDGDNLDLFLPGVVVVFRIKRGLVKYGEERHGRVRSGE
jgi:hypothetical protein